MRYTKEIVEALVEAARLRAYQHALLRDYTNAPADALQEDRAMFGRMAEAAWREVEALVARQRQRASERAYTRQLMAEVEARPAGARYRAVRCGGCRDIVPEAGDGWDGLCGNCADRAEADQG